MTRTPRPGPTKNFDGNSRDSWARLRALRSTFLESGKALETDYWKDSELLDLYDQSLGRRIAWKWEAVARELTARELLGPLLASVDTLIDWGCGSGVASEMFLPLIERKLKKLVLLDRSSLATEYARKKLTSMEVAEEVVGTQKFLEGGGNVGILVSHVINEIPPMEVSKIVKAAQMARFILWVEPGAPAQSRKLSEIRDALYSHSFQAWAPCLHQKKCPVLGDGFEKDWCHFFAPAPAEIHHSPFWSDFSKEMEIDLRSNPYSFVLLSKDPPPRHSLGARILQRPGIFKGHAEVEVCRQDGNLASMRIEKRSDGDLYKTLKKDPPLHLKLG